MGFNKSPFALEDIRVACDAALKADRGVTVTLDTEGSAKLFRIRAYYLRDKDRKMNADIYPDGHELKHQSIYDKLKFNVEGKKVTIVKYIATILNMEEL